MGGADKGKGKSGLGSEVQDELRKLAGQTTLEEETQQKERHAERRASGMKRRAEDHVPDLRPASAALCVAIAKSNSCEYFVSWLAPSTASTSPFRS